MKKRYTVLGLSVVLALALAVPALGGPTNPVASISASAKSIAVKALKKAKAAQVTANTALGVANSAQSDAKNAQSSADKAQTTATNAQKTASTALTNAATAQTAATNAQNTANAAKTAAAAAENNANNRVIDSHEAIGSVSALNATAAKNSSANCLSTEPVLGGGFFLGGSETNKVTVTSSDAQLYGHGWIAAGETIAGQTATWSITAVAMCGTK
jgi:trimeric autotransporter adhesin